MFQQSVPQQLFAQPSLKRRLRDCPGGLAEERPDSDADKRDLPEETPRSKERPLRRPRSPTESPGGLAEERPDSDADKRERKEEEELEKRREEEPREEELREEELREDLRITLLPPGENQEPQLLPLAQVQDQEENSELKLTSISTEGTEIKMPA